MNRTALLLSLLLLSLCACSSPEAAPMQENAAAPEAGSSSAAPAQAAGERLIAPISAHGGEAAAAPAASAPEGGGGIAFDIPKGWSSQPPSSSMRLAQATIPGPGGPGDLAVFFFGPGSGGSVTDNLERWMGQIEDPQQPNTESFDSNGYRVTFLDVKGTLKPSTMGTGPSTPQPGSRLLGAVIEGAGGPWFFKATGPEATIAAARDAFVALIKSVRAKGGAARPV